MGATNLIPGPNSTELAIHLGHERAGWRGPARWPACCFIVPAAVIVGVPGVGLRRVRRHPGLRRRARTASCPVVVAIIVWALVPLLRTVVKSWWLAVLVRRPRWRRTSSASTSWSCCSAARCVAALPSHGAATRRARRRQALALPLALPVFADPTGRARRSCSSRC